MPRTPYRIPVAMLVTAGLLAIPATASAATTITWPDTPQLQTPAATSKALDTLENLSGDASPTYSGDATAAQALGEQMLNVGQESPAADQGVSRVLKVFARVGALDDTGFLSLGRMCLPPALATCAVAAGVAGFEIGTAARALWFKLFGDDPHVTPGADMVNNSLTRVNIGPDGDTFYAGVNGHILVHPSMVAADYHYVWVWSWGSSQPSPTDTSIINGQKVVFDQNYTPPHATLTDQPCMLASGPTLGGLEEVRDVNTQDAYCATADGSGEEDTYYLRQSQVIDHASDFHRATQSDSSPAVHFNVNLPDRQTLLDWLNDHANDPADKAFRDALNLAVNPDSAPDPFLHTAAVPDCSGVSYDQCVSKYEDAGFDSGHLQRHTLTAATADLDRPADAVTTQSPTVGLRVGTDQDLTITTNPGTETMPSPTQAESDLAALLVSQNGNVTNDNRFEVAHECLQLEDATGSGAGENACSTLPMFVSGNDVREATDHDLDAISIESSWFALSRDDTTNKQGEGWYSGVYPCSSPTPAGKQCDEYPFFSSQQGGPNVPHLPDIKYISGRDNSVQGGKLRGFYSTCQVAKPGGPFLVVPIPKDLPVNTTSVCNLGP